MSRSWSPAAICTMDAWVMPAPAPWAKTKHARADSGLSSSAETVFALSTFNFSCCGLMTLISRDHASVGVSLLWFAPDRNRHAIMGVLRKSRVARAACGLNRPKAPVTLVSNESGGNNHEADQDRRHHHRCGDRA